jgi:hypothetical protein
VLTVNAEPDAKKASPLIALLLAFAPAATVLGFIVLGGKILKQDVLMAACLFTVICCFASSFLLFRRRTTLAIVAGILFLLLNAMIAAGFGCAALLSH